RRPNKKQPQWLRDFSVMLPTLWCSSLPRQMHGAVTFVGTLGELSVFPHAVQEFIERFVVIDHGTSYSDAAIFHRGPLQSIEAAIDEIPTFDIGIGRLRLPLLQTGIPFRLAFVRKQATGNLEPTPGVWRLDLSLDVFMLTVQGLQPAIC